MLTDVASCEYVRPFVVKELKKLNIKFNLRKRDFKVSNDPCNKAPKEQNPFSADLGALKMTEVFLDDNVTIHVPEFIADSGTFIEQDPTVEGVFRRSGSTSQKKALKALLERGNRLKITDDWNIVTVAEVMKIFFRELKEPLIPYNYHDGFLKCVTLKKKKNDALLLSCLLLPTAHRNVLIYLMRFLLRISEHSQKNRMDVENLAIIFSPNIMPMKGECKMSNEGNRTLARRVKVTRLLIENANSIGQMPESLREHLDASSESDVESSQRTKTRSSSLTRVIGALRRIVRRTSNSDETDKKNTPFRHFLTPKIVRASKNDVSIQVCKSEEKANVQFSSRTLLTPRTMVARIDTSQRNRPRRTVSFRENVESLTSETSEARVARTPTPNRARVRRSVSFRVESPDTSDSEFVQIRKDDFEAMQDRMLLMESHLNRDRKIDRVLEMSVALNRRVERVLSERHVRSPSARKIGRIRRKSNADASTSTPSRSDSLENYKLLGMLGSDTSLSHRSRTSDSSRSIKKSGSITKKPEDVGEWRNAREFFASSTKENIENRPRESVQLIRDKNAGSVLKKARMFEEITVDQPTKIPRSSCKASSLKTLNAVEAPSYGVSANRPCTKVRRTKALPPLKGTDYYRRAGTRQH